MAFNVSYRKPIPQPTESEAIVAAIREAGFPDAILHPPVPLPVDIAGNLPILD